MICITVLIELLVIPEGSARIAACLSTERLVSASGACGKSAQGISLARPERTENHPSTCV